MAILALFLCFGANAQDTSKPVVINYRTHESFPAYPLFALDSSRFNSLRVAGKKEPVVIIYFSPTCSHCQRQAEEITGHIKAFKDVQFLMVSSYPMQEIKEYVNTYALSRFPNITVASDPNFSMGQFFELKSLPGIYVYNKNGKYKTHFETNVLADTLAKAVRE